MNPGEGKVHRDCAVRCISGGIPPALRAGGKLYLLAGVNPRDILHMVAEPLTVAGRLARSGDTLILTAERLER